jgi:hypothetical protein
MELIGVGRGGADMLDCDRALIFHRAIEVYHGIGVDIQNGHGIDGII